MTMRCPGFSARHHAVEGRDCGAAAERVMDADDEVLARFITCEHRPIEQVAIIEVGKGQRARRRRTPLNDNLPRSIAASCSKHPCGIAVAVCASCRSEIRPEGYNRLGDWHAID